MKKICLAVILSPLGLLCLNPVVARAATVEIPGANLTAQNQSPSSPAPPTGGPGVENPTTPSGSPGVESPTPTSSEDLATRTQEAGKRQEETFQQRAAAVEAAAQQRREKRQAEYDEVVKKYEENKVAREEAEAKARKDTQAQARRRTQTVVEAIPLPDYPVASETGDQVAEATPTGEQVAIIPPGESKQLPKAESTQLTKRLKLGQLSFSCGTDDKNPATIARIKNKDLGIILWVSDLFASKGFDPKTRCQQVSARLEEYNKKNALAYLTTGKLNGQPVICVTSKENGNCGDGVPVHEGLLFTLRPGSNSQGTLKQLADALQNQNEKSQLKE